jgi:RNA ligase
MFYEFPKISTIDDVLPAIKGRDEFIVCDKEDYIVINYVVHMPDSFPPVTTLNDALRRECRGIVFAPDGKLLSRRFHKFFNINERPETQANLIDLSQPHTVFEKLDGSMITPLRLHNGFRWGTKMGITDVGNNAEYFAYANKKYNKFAEYCDEEEITPIFEWTSRKNRIVIDYPIDNLILTAIRYNDTGEYFHPEEMKELAGHWDIPTVATYNSQKELAQFIASVQDQQGIEGYVLRFDNGHMLKFKTSEYCLMHNSKELVNSAEYNIVQAILQEKIDDLKSLLIEEDLNRVIEFEQEFWASVNRQESKYHAIYNDVYQKSSGDRKKFALEFAKEFEPDDVPILFAQFAEQPARTAILKRIEKNSTQKLKWETFKAKHMI